MDQLVSSHVEQGLLAHPFVVHIGYPSSAKIKLFNNIKFICIHKNYNIVWLGYSVHFYLECGNHIWIVYIQTTHAFLAHSILSYQFVRMRFVRWLLFNARHNNYCRTTKNEKPKPTLVVYLLPLYD